MAPPSWISYLLIWTIIGTFVTSIGAFNYSNVTGNLRETVICLMEETGNEAFLSCESGSVIYILDHLFGYQEVPPDSLECSLPQDDECQWSSDGVDQNLRDTCMGRTECRLPIDKVFLDACGRNSDYIHIAYKCLLSNGQDEYKMVDVCGDMLGGHVVSRSNGFLETPNYPDSYPPNILCSCNLTTLQPTGEVILRVLDLDMEPGDSCGNDWVEYFVPARNQTNKICAPTDGDVISTGSNTIIINFKTDADIEGRGFWITYEGKLPDGGFSEVRLDCSHDLPIATKNAILCEPIQNITELYLDCHEVGVIDVLTTQHGYKDWGPSENCNVVLDDPCAVQADIREDVMARCMGEGTCVVDVHMIPLPFCNKDSNYFQVQYQCIPNVQDPNFIVDICGDSIITNNIRRSHGYIESPDYPALYPPNLACYCFLATDADAHILIRLLDVEIAGAADNGVCGDDWLDFRQPSQAGGSGRRVCDESLGQWIQTEGNEVYVEFFSDGAAEERGFWFEYSAKKRFNGAEANVELSCSQTIPIEPERVPDPPTVSDDGEDTHHTGNHGPTNHDAADENADDAVPRESTQPANIGLIVGLCFIGGLMLLVILIMVILRYRKIREDKGPSVPETTAQVDTPLDKSYNTLKKYSALASSRITSEQNYSTLHNDSRNSSVRGGINNGRENPDSIDTITGSNLPASYINPSFDGSPEGGNPTPNPTV